MLLDQSFLSHWTPGVSSLGGSRSLKEIRSALPRLWAESACVSFDQRPHGVASMLLGKAHNCDGDSLGDPYG